MDPLLGQIYSVNRGTPEGPEVPINLDDPANIDWAALQRQYGFTPEQMDMLQVPQPAEGPSLRQRVEALSGGINVGNVNLNIEDEMLRGTMRF